MKIRSISVGKIREKYLLDAIGEYTKRMQAYAKIENIIVADESIPDTYSTHMATQIMDKEGQKILRYIKDKDLVIVLDRQGKMLDSIELSNMIEQNMIAGTSTFTFIIGGSLGCGQDVLQRADFLLSFSKMTFPHPLMKVILVEQLYRSFKIMRKESYHK